MKPDGEHVQQSTIAASSAAHLRTTGPSSVFDLARPSRTARVKVTDVDIASVHVEQGVPLPPNVHRKGGAYGTILSAMEVGDSFLVSRALDKTVRSSVRTYRKLHGGEFATRIVSEAEVRVWRTA